jgi:hypothetical protein
MARVVVICEDQTCECRHWRAQVPPSWERNANRNFNLENLELDLAGLRQLCSADVAIDY